MAANIRAAFWDIDGTMVMSEPVHEAKMGHIAGLHDIVLPDGVHARFHGIGDYLAYEIMCEHGYPGSEDDFMNACFDYYRERLHTIDVRDGFMDAFNLFEGKGVHQAAVSNGTAPLVIMNIERAGIGERLHAVVDLDYIEGKGMQGKPAADPYLEALRIVNEKNGLDIKPSECLVIEDSATGVAAGKAAGMSAIYWMLTEGLSNPQADFEAHSAEDLMGILKRHFI